MPKNLRHIRGAAVVCLAAGADERPVPPTEFRVFAAGAIETTKGTFLFDEEGAEKLLEHRRKRGVDVRLDYEHASVNPLEAADPGRAGKAAGWIPKDGGLELRDGELWATNVKWTPPAAEALANGEYRYLSPTFWAERETGRIAALDSVALTNDPATLDAEPLVHLSARDLRTERVALAMSFEDIARKLRDALAKQFEDVWLVDIFDEYVVFEAYDRNDRRSASFRCGYTVTNHTITLDGDAVEVIRQYEPVEGGKTMKTLLKALGLSENATEAEALQALNTKLSEAQAKATAVELKLGELVGLTGKSSPAEAAGVVEAWKQSAAKVTELSVELASLRAKETEREIVGLVDEAVKAGKAVPAQREALLAHGRKDPVSLKAFIEASPVIHQVASGEFKPPEGGADVVTLSAEDEAIIRQMNLSRDEFLATKKAERARA